jgi:hypothetical protein
MPFGATWLGQNCTSFRFRRAMQSSSRLEPPPRVADGKQDRPLRRQDAESTNTIARKRGEVPNERRRRLRRAHTWASSSRQSVTPVGTKVQAFASDPWEFCETHGPGPFGGKVVATGRHRGLYWWIVHLSAPIVEGGVAYPHVAALARHEGSELLDIFENGNVSANFTLIGSEEATLPPAEFPEAAAKNPGFVGSLARDHLPGITETFDRFE